MTLADLLLAFTLACAQGQDVTPALQALLDTGQPEVTLPAQMRACRLRTATMRTREQSLTAHGVTFHAIGAPSDPMLLLTADWTTVRGGVWVGQGGTYVGASPGSLGDYGRGLIEVRGGAYARVTEATLVDAPASAVAVLDAPNAEISRVHALRPRGRAFLFSGSSWGTVQESIIEAPRHDGVSILLGSAHVTVIKTLVDYTDTVEWSVDPYPGYCGYVQGIVAWGDATDANVIWNTIRGPRAPRPPCHLFIGISLANKSDGSAARQNVVDGASGVTYCLEIADADGVSLDTNWVSGCQVAGVSLVHGDTYTGRPTANALVKGNDVTGPSTRGISVGGHVQGARVEGNTVRGVGVPIEEWSLYGGMPSGVELVGNQVAP